MKKTYIIAEIGCNHNGSKELAFKMIDEAAKAGVDAIKFQTFKSENLVSKKAEKAEYQKRTTNQKETQLQMLKNLELSFEDFNELFEYVRKKKLDWFSTPFDLESMEFLQNLNMDIWKIPSGELTNLLYLEAVSKLEGKVIISTGMATLEEIDEALNVLVNGGKKKSDITILHCITEYPASDDEMNLNTIPYFKNRYSDYNIGLSDHSQGEIACITAVALGATMVEKHFTLDNDFPGPDHKASADLHVLTKIVHGIRTFEIMRGGVKEKPTNSEIKNIPIARKSLVAKTLIKKGQVFTKENLTIKRPGNGISPMKWYEYIGKEAKKDYNVDDLI